MKTATWNQVNTALKREGLRPANVLKILLAMPGKGSERTGATVYTTAEIFKGITDGYPFGRPLAFGLANRVVGQL